MQAFCANAPSPDRPIRSRCGPILAALQSVSRVSYMAKAVMMLGHRHDIVGAQTSRTERAQAAGSKCSAVNMRNEILVAEFVLRSIGRDMVGELRRCPARYMSRGYHSLPNAGTE